MYANVVCPLIIRMMLHSPLQYKARWVFLSFLIVLPSPPTLQALEFKAAAALVVLSCPHLKSDWFFMTRDSCPHCFSVQRDNELCGNKLWVMSKKKKRQKPCDFTRVHEVLQGRCWRSYKTGHLATTRLELREQKWARHGKVRRCSTDSTVFRDDPGAVEALSLLGNCSFPLATPLTQKDARSPSRPQ